MRLQVQMTGIARIDKGMYIHGSRLGTKSQTQVVRLKDIVQQYISWIDERAELQHTEDQDESETQGIESNLFFLEIRFEDHLITSHDHYGNICSNKEYMQ